MQRRSTSQDISWFLDLRRGEQIELNPPYQRRSVWNLKDRRFFLDTVFRGYPCPPLFLHKTVNTDQRTIYAVVDGKQRLQTLFQFVDGQIAISSDYGDARLAGKSWDELGPAERQLFWDYVMPVEFLTFDANDPHEVNQAFDRLNRNMRKLEAQELRHARWDGWFINLVEAECEDPKWRALGVVTNARAKRMKDAQFISELLMVLIEKRQIGFDQQVIDAAYAKYDDLEELDLPISPDEIKEQLDELKTFLYDAQQWNACVKQYANTFTAFYTLWALVVLYWDNLPEAPEFADEFASFMARVRELDAIESFEERANRIQSPGGEAYRRPLEFLQASKGANTDITPRAKRLEALASHFPLA